MASKAELEAVASTLKRQARRRLIGAIALALLAVIVLPMVFDAEKKPLDADIAIQIPDKDAVVTRGSGAITPGAPQRSGKDSASASAQVDHKPGVNPESKSAGKSEGKSDGKSAGLAEKPVEPKPETKAEPKGAAKGAVKGEIKSDVAPEAKSPVAPVAKPEPARGVKDVAEDKRAAAILGAKSDAAKESKLRDAAAASGGFAVQIGAFAGDDKVREARDKLSAANIKTYTEKLDTKDGERTRVRAGPFASREQADTARDRIKGLGFAGAVVVTR